MRPVSLWPLVLAAGCDSFFKGDDSLPEVSPLYACVRPDGEASDDWAWQQEASLRGEVVLVGSGEGTDCEISYETMSAGDAAVEDLSWMYLDDVESGQRWQIAVAASSFALPFAEGDEALVEWAFEPPQFSQGRGQIFVKDWESAPVFWMGQSSALDDIVPPSGLFFAAGDVVGHVKTDCGDYEGYDLDVSADGDEGVVPYGEAAMVGGRIVHHGGLAETVSTTSRCQDWGPDTATVAVVW